MFMLFAGFMFPKMVILYGDDTPPVYMNLVPSSISYSSLPYLQAYVKDVDSGIQSVTCTISGTTYTLVYGDVLSGYEVWDCDIPDITAEGNYSYSWVIKNKAGLTSTPSGTFTIYTALQGNWYVNDILITSPTQEVWSKSTTFAFKFVKTAGIADSSITCTGWEGGTKIFTLVNTAASTWSGSFTFSLGKHTLDLQATDGTGIIHMNIFEFQVGDKPLELPQLNMLQIFGLASTGIGLLLIFTDKTRAKKR